ncbi:unnamed protein product [Brassicogethes aeneus]|uniref:UBC core domain-containing protein n=1 Tax=Brassicogethes aeneus TaxID=1431903 RepID=A0A9P0BIK8_BRAAE|nr:unnamed protein product [Brassicogethes aeneus]
MSVGTDKDKVKEFYSNDIVYKFDKNKRITFGVVIDSYEASSDVDEYHSLQKGQIRLLWSNHSLEQVWSQSKVRLINRGILPGDVVRRLVKGKETQRGYCKETKQTATLQIVGTDKVIEHVCSDRLQSIRPFETEDAVCLDNKFGRIDTIEQIVTMQSKCGSMVEVLTSINHDLDDYWLSKRNRISFDTYYPGQEVICVPANFEQPHWIKKSKSMKRNMQSRQRFTIQSVSEYVMEVAWYGNSAVNMAELSTEEIKKLKVLEHPSDTCLELNDRKLLKLSSSDVLLKKKDWTKKLSLTYRPEVPKVRHIVNCNTKMQDKMAAKMPRIRLYSCVETGEPEEDWWTEEGEVSDDNCSTSSRSPSSKQNRRHYPPKPRELVPGATLPVEVICVESKVTVLWQDGTEEKDIPSTQLYYSISLDDHEFFPGEVVVPDNGKEDKEEKDSEKYGVVQRVNYLERTATIKWFTYSEALKKPIQKSMTEMSVYDLKKHSKFVFRPGIVVKSKPTESEKIGTVIDSCIEGHVKVQWLDKSTGNCWPQEIEQIPDSVDYEYSDSETSDEERMGGESWETESIESYAGDVTDETALQNMAARLDFVRSRIVYLREAFKQHTITENFTFLKDLLLVYDNSSYLDKLLGTSFFSLKSRHFQTLLMQAKEKAKTLGVELRGRIFSSDATSCPPINRSHFKVAEKENISKMIKLENKIQAEIEKKESPKETPTVTIAAIVENSDEITQENLCVELLSMLKMRMDLAYAEIISRIGGTQALTVLTKASENACVPTPLPSVPSTPDDATSACPLKKVSSKDSDVQIDVEADFWMVDEAPAHHHYFANKTEPTDRQQFMKAINKEFRLLKESLPPGVWIRTFANRTDLLSVMIRGPAKTPYEDGLFLFDMQLSNDYPRSPPLVHYISFSSERLNPNLYVEGKVCVSLLGTWMGRGTEVWGPNSTLLQLIVSIQGLILVSEPYYNEAGYEKQTDTQQGYENSRTYNELVILKLVQSMTEMLQNPPQTFKEEVLNHFSVSGKNLCDRLGRFCSDEDPLAPDFPLLPVSKGLKLSLNSALKAFEENLNKMLKIDV